MTDPTSTRAGWYDDGSGNLGYRGGTGWTEHAAAEHTWSFDELTTGPVQPHSPTADGAGTPQPVAPFTEPSNPKPHVLAIIALVVSIVGAVVATAVSFLFVPTAITDTVGQVDDVVAEASGAAGAPDELDESTAGPAPDALGTLSFGESNVWEDGVELRVSAPEPYTPSEFASGAGLAENLVFAITITNNSGDDLEPSPFPQLSSGGQEASQIFDVSADGQDVSVPPATVIRPGQSVTWRAAWSVADPNTLTMQVAPNLQYEDVIFTNIR